MDSITFEKVIENRIDKCKQLLGIKAGEYATDDRLHNFKVSAILEGCTPEKSLAGMMAKHTVSVYDLINRFEEGEYIPNYNFCANQYGDTDYFDDEDIVADVEKYCNQAEDKTKYIKLPCKVGDTVYYPCGGKIYEKKVVCFMIKPQKTVVFF